MADRDPRERGAVRVPVRRPGQIEAEVEEQAAKEDEALPLEEKLERARAEAAEWRDRYLRLAADLENTKKRAERIHADRSLKEREQLIRELLPLVDNLERAVSHATPAEQQSGLFSGVELTLRDVLGVLARHGVKRIDALGEPFNPELHEAIGAAPHPSLPPGTVMHVELPGYTYRDRLLRPARVLVTAG